MITSQEKVRFLIYLVVFLLDVSKAFSETSSDLKQNISTWLTDVTGHFGPSWIDKKNPTLDPNKEQLPFGTQKTLRLPMCFFFDPITPPEKANAKIQNMVKSYGACGIALQPFTFFLQPGYPQDPDLLLQAAMKSCPINDHFGIRGAIQIEVGSKTIPQKMCHNSESLGCSTLCEPLSISVVAPGSGSWVALHESMHSNCCGPVCVDTGSGGGLPAGPDLEIANIQVIPQIIHSSFTSTLINTQLEYSVDWQEIIPNDGCRALRAGASPNEINEWVKPDNGLYVIPISISGTQIDFQHPKDILPRLAIVETKSKPQQEINNTKQIFSETASIEETPEEESNIGFPKLAKKDIPKMSPGIHHKLGSGRRAKADSNITYIDAFNTDEE